MKRTKEWWAALTKEERSTLVYLEKADKQISCRSPYLPDDCAECPACSNPGLGSGLCSYCCDDLIRIIDKANITIVVAKEKRK